MTADDMLEIIVVATLCVGALIWWAAVCWRDGK